VGEERTLAEDLIICVKKGLIAGGIVRQSKDSYDIYKPNFLVEEMKNPLKV
jgi:hypothetical protein